MVRACHVARWTQHGQGRGRAYSPGDPGMAHCVAEPLVHHETFPPGLVRVRARCRSSGTRVTMSPEYFATEHCVLTLTLLSHARPFLSNAPFNRPIRPTISALKHTRGELSDFDGNA